MIINKIISKEAAETVFSISTNFCSEEQLKLMLEKEIIKKINDNFCVELNNIKEIKVKYLYGFFYNIAVLEGGCEFIIKL